MSREEVVVAYLQGGMSRRTFIRRLVGLGVSTSAAITYAYALEPERAAAATKLCFYDTQAPAVTTGAATDVTPTTATLTASVTPNLLATICWLEIGASPSYGDATRVVDVGAGNVPAAASAPVSGLAPGTTYHYRAVAQNAAGRTAGADATFSTPADPDTAPPALGVEVLYVARTALMRRRRLTVLVTSPEAANGRLTATMRLAGRRRTVAKGTFSLSAGGAQKVVLKLSVAAARALRAPGSPALALIADGADAAGNRAAARTTIRL